MAIKDDVLKKIKDEITLDPYGIGYAGKTDEEIVVLLNSPVQKQVVITEVYPSPMNRIMSGIEEVENIVTLEEVKDAKK